MNQDGSDRDLISGAVHTLQCVLKQCGSQADALLAGINSKTAKHCDTDWMGSQALCNSGRYLFAANADRSECVVSANDVVAALKHIDP